MGEYSRTLPPLKTEPEYISGSVFSKRKPGRLPNRRSLPEKHMYLKPSFPQLLAILGVAFVDAVGAQRGVNLSWNRSG